MRFLSLCLLLCAPATVLASIGVFTDVTGDTRIQRGEFYLAAAPGVEVEESDIIETGSNASAQVEMRDGTLLKLGADSRLLLADYRLDNGGNVVSAGLEVLSGWLRFAVSKLRASDSRYAISTPTMTIGIRGTGGVIEAQSTHGGLFLEEGEVAAQAANAGSVPVRAGEYIERAQGRPFARPAAVPAAFQARMPATVRPRMTPRAQLLPKRGVPPRQIRRLQQEDRERYLRQNPHLRQNFEQRFRASPGTGAGSVQKTPYPQKPLPQKPPSQQKHQPLPQQPPGPQDPEKKKKLQDKKQELEKKKKLKKREQNEQVPHRPDGAGLAYSGAAPA
jgi:hypothetical protein